VSKTIGEHEGRRLFGADAARYERSRPAYPAVLFAVMREQGVLFSGARTLEIGGGSGIATRQLAAAGATPITVIESDARFHASLRAAADHAGSEPTILGCSFEEADLPRAQFDLIVAATSFHWLDSRTRAAKLADLNKLGGTTALLWNVFQNPDKDDAFHHATRDVLEALAPSPSGAPDTLPFALDRRAREMELTAGGAFELSAYVEVRWTLTLDTAGVRDLYSGFSPIARVPEVERERLLDRLADIADAEFSGRVVRNMTSPLYLFRRH